MDMIKKYRVYIVIAISLSIIIAGYMHYFTGSLIVWKKGDKQMYMMEQISKVFIIYNGMRIPTESRMSGVLNMKVLDVEDGEASVAIQFSKVIYWEQGSENRGYEQILSRPFQVKFDKYGSILNYNFRNQIAHGDDEFYMNIMSFMNLTLEKPLFNSWKTIERDTIGKYKAYYQKMKRYIKREKKLYSETSMKKRFGNVDVTDAKIDVLQAVTKVRIDDKKSWIRTLNLNERSIIYKKGKKNAEVLNYVKLQRLPFEPDNRLEIWNDSAFAYRSLDDDWSNPCSSCLDEKYSYKERAEKYIMNKMLKGVTVNTLMNELNTKAIDDYKFYKKLLAYLKMYPESADEFYKEVLERKYGSKQIAKLMQCMVDTGHEPAQRFLRNMLTEPLVPKTVHLMSAINMGLLLEPSNDTIEKLKEVFKVRETQDDKLISNSTILAMGAMSGRIRGNTEMAKQKAEMERYIVETLENNKNDENIASSCVAALGSTKNKDYEDIIESYLIAPQGMVRTNAIIALNTVAGEDAVDTIRSRYKYETDPSARDKIIEVMGHHPPEGETIDLCMENYFKEEDKAVRMEMIRYIVKNRNERTDEIKEMLRKALTVETSKPIRDIINRGIYSKRDNPLGEQPPNQ